MYACKWTYYRSLSTYHATDMGFLPNTKYCGLRMCPGRGPTGLRARVRNRSRLENRSHVVLKRGFQDGGDRTRIFTHKITILAQFMTWYINFLAWRQRMISLVCFANSAIHSCPQVMPIFDREMLPGFTPAICLRCNFVYISSLVNRGDKSLDQNF